MVASTAVCAARRGVALAVVTVVVVVSAAATTAWGAPSGAGTPTAATATRAGAAAGVPAEVADKGVASLDGVASLRVPKKQWVKPASKKWGKPASKKWVKPASKKWVNAAAKKPAPKKWVKTAAKQPAKKWVKPVSKAPPPPPSRAGPACSPLKPYLTEYYTLAWRLAMLDHTAARAFGIFATARAHAAAYVAAHPKTPTTVCGLHPVTAALTRRAVQIVADHRDRRGALPPGGRFRNMKRWERAAMATVLAVPLRKAVPKKSLPKHVPLTL